MADSRSKTEVLGDAVGGRVTAWLGRAKDLTSLVTVSGFTAVLYAIGYIALSRRAETLGIPQTTEGAGAYWRAGYFCAIDTLESFVTTARLHWVLSLALVTVAAVAIWATYRTTDNARSRRIVTISVAFAYVVVLALIGQTAANIREAFAATGLLTRTQDELANLGPGALCVVAALSHNQPAKLAALYGEMVWRTAVVGGVLATVVLSAHAVREPIVTRAKWLVLIALIAQASLLPFLYGTCFLAAVPTCVEIALAPDEEKKLSDAGAKEFVNPKGFLASDLDEKVATIQVLVPQSPKNHAPPSLHLIPRTRVNAIRFIAVEGNCDGFLSGFRDVNAVCPYPSSGASR